MELSNVLSHRETGVEAELYFNIGKVEGKLLTYGCMPLTTVINTLVEAIKLSHTNDHDLGLMRQAYLEIAMAHLYVSNVPSQLDTQSEISIASASSVKKPRRKLVTSSTKSARRGRITEDTEDDPASRYAAWVAIRCAQIAAQCQRNLVTILGNPAVSSEVIPPVCISDVPDFAALDLMSNYVLGSKRQRYKTEMEEALSQMKNVNESKDVRTYDDDIRDSKEMTGRIRWIHFLGYRTALHRLLNYTTIQTANQPLPDNQPANNCIRTGVFTNHWSLRLTKLHSFLTTHLAEYSTQCCGIYPLDVFTKMSLYSYMIDYAPYPITITHYTHVERQAEADSSLDLNTVDLLSSRTELLRPYERFILYAVENEVTFQWYQPSLSDRSTNDQMLLLYVGNKRAAKPTKSVGQVWIPYAQLLDLHSRLSILVQRGELVIADKLPKKSSAPSATPTPSSSIAKGKKGAAAAQKRIKALSPKIERDEMLESLCKQCIDDIGALLGARKTMKEDDGEPAELPFELTKANLTNLKHLFDPIHGGSVKATDLAAWLHTYSTPLFGGEFF